MIYCLFGFFIFQFEALVKKINQKQFMIKKSRVTVPFIIPNRFALFSLEPVLPGLALGDVGGLLGGLVGRVVPVPLECLNEIEY